MSQYPKLDEYIQKAREKGLTDEQIKQEMLGAGYNQEDIKNVFFGSEVLNQQQPVQNSQKESKFPWIALVVLFLIFASAASVYAYTKIDPFFLKSTDKIFESTLKNTSDFYNSNNFSAYTDILIRVDSSESFVPMNIRLNIPVKYQVKQHVSGSTNSYFQIGDIDLRPIIDSTIGMMAFFLEEGEDLNILKSESKINFEVKIINNAIYARINKIPEIVKSFVPSNIVDQVVGNWIEIPSTMTEKLSGFGIPSNSLEPLSEEQSQKIISEVKDVLLVRAEPQISTRKVDGGKLELTYVVENQKVFDGLLNSDLMNTLSEEFDSSYGDAELNTVEFRKEIKEQKIPGNTKIILIINKNFVIDTYNIEINSTIDEGFGRVDFSYSIDGSYISENELKIDIEIPQSTIPIEEIMSMVYLEMMGLGSGDFSDLEMIDFDF